MWIALQRNRGCSLENTRWRCVQERGRAGENHPSSFDAQQTLVKLQTWRVNCLETLWIRYPCVPWAALGFPQFTVPTTPTVRT